MKIAIVISGLARFPEQGFYFLEEIKKRSKHEIDIYAGVWSIDTIPESITNKLKGLATIPYSLRDDLRNLLENNNLLSGHLNETFIETHSGLISHMATCSVFSEDLKKYHAVVKWRWDVAVLSDYFELFCTWFNGSENTLLTDDVHINCGKPFMNEVVFISSPELMIKSFTPVKEKFLKLGLILENNFKERKNYILSTFTSHGSLVAESQGTIKTAPLNWALLRKNILDNPKLLYSNNIDTFIKLQKEADKERDRLLLENNKNNK